MNSPEGVIKFQLEHQQSPYNNNYSVKEINAWRHIFFRLLMIGQNNQRYDGYGFGNISQRIDPDKNSFIISGTQTGHLEHLHRDEYCLIKQANPHKNQIISKGMIKPSSEALTHAMVYQLDNTIQAVIHVHSPEIWNLTQSLHLPFIPSNIAYGTPKMAQAVRQLHQSGQLDEQAIFSMSGHKDGIVSFGSSLQQAATILINTFARALQLNYRL